MLAQQWSPGTSKCFTLPETIIAPEIFSKRKLVFQPSIFRCYVSFREGNPFWKGIPTLSLSFTFHSPPWNKCPSILAFLTKKGQTSRSPPRHKSTLAMHLSLLHVSFIGTAVTPQTRVKKSDNFCDDVWYFFFSHAFFAQPQNHPCHEAIQSEREMTPSISWCY